MKKRVTNAKIACLDINLQKTRMNLGVHITIDDPEQLEAIRRRCAYIAIYTCRVVADGRTESPRSLSSACARSSPRAPT